MIGFLWALWSDRRGVSHLEYGLLAFGMVGVVLLLAETMGSTLTLVFERLGSFFGMPAG